MSTFSRYNIDIRKKTNRLFQSFQSIMKKIREKLNEYAIKAKEFFAEHPKRARVAIVTALFAFVMLILCIRMIFLSLAPPFDFSAKNLSLFT